MANVNSMHQFKTQDMLLSIPHSLIHAPSCTNTSFGMSANLLLNPISATGLDVTLVAFYLVKYDYRPSGLSSTESGTQNATVFTDNNLA